MHDDKKLNALLSAQRPRRHDAPAPGLGTEDEFVFPTAESAARPARRWPGGRRRTGQLQGLRVSLGDVGLRDGRDDTAGGAQAATIDGARIIGFAEDLGSLEVGKLADLVVLDRNPLTDIRNTNSVRYVMKNGELYEGDTLNQIWPARRKLQKFWWWNTESH